jgi:NADP-dependent 3-hydroxy acid dehydrogenase YdfG
MTPGALCWDVHVMAHVYAARAVLPGMIERGSGLSAADVFRPAGLLSQIGDAAYSATKHCSHWVR